VVDNATTLAFRESDKSLWIASSYGINILEFYYEFNDK
jgi:hypothetical protein